MFHTKIIVIGSSAGGVTALQELVEGLPADFQTPIFIVQHVDARTHSHLPEILSRKGNRKVEHPTDGQRIEPSAIYVAPPDHHMIIEGEYILIKKGPKENRFRQCIDTLFRSAAYSYKENVIGVILTGMLDDGSSGMWSVKRMGGITIVQDPAEALYASMPSSVLQYTDVDYVLPLSKISALLTEIVAEPIKQHAALDEKQEKLLKTEIEIAGEENGFDKGILEMGDPSNLTCPDCGGQWPGSQKVNISGSVAITVMHFQQARYSAK
jgi:two-component system chemotaxis response regulator CheB